MSTESQRHRIMRILYDNPEGVTSIYLGYDVKPGMKQNPARIWELRHGRTADGRPIKEGPFDISSTRVQTKDGTWTALYRLETPRNVIDTEKWTVSNFRLAL